MSFLRKRSPASRHFTDDRCVLVWGNDDGHILPILGGGANHCGPADVDILDQFFERSVLLGGHLLELVQAHRHQIDTRDAVLRERPHVLGLGTDSKNSTGDAWMNRLHAAIQHLRELPDLGDLAQRRNAGIFQHSKGPACGENLYAKTDESFGEIDDPSLVGDTEESTLDAGHGIFHYGVL